MEEATKKSQPANRAVAFGLISVLIHAGARIFIELKSKELNELTNKSEPEAAVDLFTGLLDGKSPFGPILEMVQHMRTLQMLDVAATVFAILGVSYAAIAGHRGDRSPFFFIAWILSILGLLMWAGHFMFLRGMF